MILLGKDKHGNDIEFHPKHGYGSFPEKITGLVTYEEDRDVKMLLLDIISHPRTTNKGEDGLIAFITKGMVSRRLTVMEAIRIKSISARKINKTPSFTLDTKGKDTATASLPFSEATHLGHLDEAKQGAGSASAPIKTVLGTDFTEAQRIIEKHLGKG